MEIIKSNIPKLGRTATKKDGTPIYGGGTQTNITNLNIGTQIKDIVPTIDYTNLDNLNTLEDAGIYNIMESNEYSGMLIVSAGNSDGD